ncbi:MAG: aminopeptidase P family protein, partial [Ignavibacteriaceae bacterium]|nr:aminopeptidase P family protein [Ignavibacteriaceae bacterium]
LNINLIKGVCMFDKKVYIKRREILKKKVKSGLILLLGNDESPMNYMDNTYHFRQDSTFLYYFGIDFPGLAAVIDIDDNADVIFGNDFTIDDIVWMGPQPTIAQRAVKSGIKLAGTSAELKDVLLRAASQGRKVHFIPQYRYDNMMKLEALLDIRAGEVNNYVSPQLIKAIVEQRTIKSSEEIKEIEKAIDISYDMQTSAMQITIPGIKEQEIAGYVQGIAAAKGNGLSFPIIFSKHGETLHNHGHDNILRNGDLVVNDSGTETNLHYASDITRTFPVSGKFSDRQKEIYQIVLDANMEAIKAVKPGIFFKDVHLRAASVIATGLKELGFLKGDVKEIVKEGAHALFFPHGLGHLLGLDVHDMENLGEVYTGYHEKIKRSTQFGLKSLRYAKEMKPGTVLTIEPGIYFIPELIHKWEAEGKFTQFINYKKAKEYIGFGGIRIEDDILVTRTGSRVLGKPIPKTIEEVEQFCSNKN